MTLAGPLLQRYFTDYLIAQRRLSPQTLASYRDTFRLLLQFVQSELKIEPSRLAVDQLDAEVILRFLDSLEQRRKNIVVSRNLRLTAIRSFFRMAALHNPECAGTATRVLAIPMKRTAKRLLEYVSRTEMDAILNSIDRKHWCGRRDYLRVSVQKGHVSMIHASGVVWIRAAMFSRQRLQVTTKSEYAELGPWNMRTV
jgi:integrase/recombinase XerD